MADFTLPQILNEIDKQAAAFGVNPNIAKSIIVAENTGSGSTKVKTTYSGDAVSSAGAMGVGQVMPATAAGLQKAGFLPSTWKHDPENLGSQIQATLAAMAEKQQRMNDPNDLGEWASVYNGSSATHRAYKAGKTSQLPQETQQYIPKLRRAMMELTGQAGNNPSAFTAGPSGAGGTGPGTAVAGNSSRTSVRRNVQDPDMLNMFLSDAMGAVGTGGTFDQAELALDASTTARTKAALELESAIGQKATAAGAAATADAAVLAAGQAKRAQILTSMNLDPAITGNEMQRALGVVNDTDMQLARLKPEIDARMAVGFFDNPLEWLVNQTRLPGMVSEYNGIVGVQKDAQQRYAGLAQIANTQQTLSGATEADLIARGGQAKAELAAKDAVVDATKVRFELAGNQARDAMQMAQLTGQKLNIEAGILAQTKQSVTESAGESERAKIARAEEENLSNINAILVAAGGNPIPSVAQFKQLPAAKKEMLLSAATSGSFGKDFAESFGLVWNDGNREKMAKTGGAAVVHWVNGTVAKAGTMLEQERKNALAQGNKKWDGKKELPNLLNQQQQIYQVESATDMRTASEYNPFKLDYATAAKDPALKGNSVAIWLQQYGPQGTTPMMQKVDEQFIIQKFAQSVSAGTMKAPQAAADISNFYKIATRNQMLLTKPQLFGLSTPEKTYPVKITGVGIGSTNLDLGNQSQVENALTKKVAHDTAVKLATEQSAFPIRQIFGIGEN
jgi:hypothetical protein